MAGRILTWEAVKKTKKIYRGWKEDFDSDLLSLVHGYFLNTKFKIRRDDI